MTLTQLVGGQHRLTLDNEEILVNPFDLDKEVEFEQRLLQKLTKSLQAMKPHVDPQEYNSLIKSTNESYALGELKPLGVLGQKMLMSVQGLCMVGAMLTGLPEDKVLRLTTKHPEFGAKLGLVVREGLGVDLGQ